MTPSRARESTRLINVFWLLLLVSTAQAATLHVPSDYPTIQAGVDASSPGDTVLVAPGTYSQTTERTIQGQLWKAVLFPRANVVVLSEQGAASTILNLEISGLRTAIVAVIDIQSAGTIPLEGFTLTNGSAVLIECEFCSKAVTLHLRDCVLDGQQDGIGVYGQNTKVFLEHTTIRNCYQGVFLYSNAPYEFTALDCSIEGSERGIEIQGVSLVTIQSSTFSSNAGSLAIYDNADGEISGCRFIGNTESTQYAVPGILVYSYKPSDTSDLRITNNVFAGNAAYNAPSALSLAFYSGNYIIQGNTFTGNASSSAAIHLYEGQAGSTLTFTNNIVHGTLEGPSILVYNNSGQLNAGCNVHWNNLYENPLSDTDRIVSPQFCDLAQGDYHLGSSSPCLPANSGGCGLIGALGEACITHPVTISTVPLLTIQLELDGYSHPAPIADGWVPGSTHSVEAPTQHIVNIPDRYSFLQWEDGSINPTRVIEGPSAPAAYEAIYVYDPYPNITLSSSPVLGLTVRLDEVNFITPHSFYAEEQETHQLFVPSPQFLTPADRYYFKEWEDGSTNPTRTVTIPDSDFTYSANFEYDPLATMNVLSSPGPGVTVLVDQVDRTTPFTGYYETSTTHTLFVPSPQNLPNRQYVFKSWEDGSTNPNRTVVLGDSAATYTYTAFFDVLFSEVAVTVATDPPNNLITVDDVDYQSPAVLIWEKGTPHTISSPALIPKTEGTRLRFDHWSDNGAITHVVTAPASAATYTAFLTTQHQVFATAGLGGQVAPIPEWNDEGSIVSLQAFPDPRFEFGGWVGTGSGSYTGPNNPTTVTVLGPILETAEFTPIQFELSFSLSDSDPLVNTGSPLGFGAIYYWAICSGDLGIGSVDLDLDIQGLSVAAFVPSPGVLHTFDGTNLTVTAPDCMPMPGVIGTFYVTDPAGGRICADTTVGPGGIPSPTVLECKPSPLSYQGLHYTRIHGCRTDGAPACVAGNGCAAPPIAPPLLSLTATATDRAAEIAWAASAESKSDGYLIDRSAAGGAFERLTQSILPPSSSMRFVDEGLAAETEYAYRVLAVWAGIESSMGEVSVRTLPASSGTITALLPSRPNPFSDQTQIGFVLAAPSYAKLSIYDVAGRRVRTLADGIHPAGERHLIWEGRTDHGVNVTSGVYFLKLETPQVERISKLILRRQN